jgi:hypothetical protein
VWGGRRGNRGVERGDPGLVVPLGQRDHAGIGGIEPEVGVRVDEFCDWDPVLGGEWLDCDLAGGNGLVKGALGGDAELASDQSACFGDH